MTDNRIQQIIDEWGRVRAIQAPPYVSATAVTDWTTELPEEEKERLERISRLGASGFGDKALVYGSETDADADVEPLPDEEMTDLNSFALQSKRYEELALELLELNAVHTAIQLIGSITQEDCPEESDKLTIENVAKAFIPDLLARHLHEDAWAFAEGPLFQRCHAVGMALLVARTTKLPSDLQRARGIVAREAKSAWEDRSSTYNRKRGAVAYWMDLWQVSRDESDMAHARQRCDELPPGDRVAGLRFIADRTWAASDILEAIRHADLLSQKENGKREVRIMMGAIMQEMLRSDSSPEFLNALREVSEKTENRYVKAFLGEFLNGRYFTSN